MRCTGPSHARLGREVALKVVPPERARDAAAQARFHREMAALGKLDHPNVVRATDAGEVDGVAYLVMDLVDGIDLGAAREDVRARFAWPTRANSPGRPPRGSSTSPRTGWFTAT